MKDSDNKFNSSSEIQQPVLPDLEKKAIIDSFRGDFGFLSNFYEASVYIDGKRYRSAEHAYQAMKFTDPAGREVVRNARSPGEAKKLGKSAQLPRDWESKKVTIMHDIVRKKFDNPFLKEMLLATEDAELIEGNHWGDRFWGVCKGSGQNFLGKILMEVRDEIRNKKE